MNAPEPLLLEYNALPDAIKAVLSYLEYQWLSGPEKAHLLQAETEPDCYDD